MTINERDTNMTIIKDMAKAVAWGAIVATVMTLLFVATHKDIAPANASAPHTTTSAPEWTHQLPVTMRRPCPTEDSFNCYWDAGRSGNGQGHSFIVRKFRHQTCWMYRLAADARRWDHCEKDYGIA